MAVPYLHKLYFSSPPSLLVFLHPLKQEEQRKASSVSMSFLKQKAFLSTETRTGNLLEKNKARF